MKRAAKRRGEEGFFFWMYRCRPRRRPVKIILKTLSSQKLFLHRNKEGGNQKVYDDSRQKIIYVVEKV